jgi:hypothetical protein
MPNKSTGSPRPLLPHSNEVEHRLTTAEVRSDHHQHSLSDHHDRIIYLERAVQGLIWATSVLATGKSGDIVDIFMGMK